MQHLQKKKKVVAAHAIKSLTKVPLYFVTSIQKN